MNPEKKEKYKELLKDFNIDDLKKEIVMSINQIKLYENQIKMMQKMIDDKNHLLD